MTGVTRRTILAGVGSAGAVSLAVMGTAKPAVATHGTVRLLSTYVAGAGNHGLPRRRIMPGEAIDLRREPDNGYDAGAVSVWTADGVKLGYVPRIHNEALANLMDAGFAAVGRAGTVTGPAPRPDIGIEILIRIA